MAKSSSPRPRKKRLRVAGINIVSHPHSPERYVFMIERARECSIGANYYGNRWGSIGAFQKENRGYYGSLFLYTHVNIDKPWLDLERGEEADPEEISRSIRLPKNLKPEFTPVQFVFFPKEHKLLFERIVAPASVARIFENILKNNQVKGDAEDVKAHVIQDKGNIESLLHLPNLRKLEIMVMRPNPDDLAKHERILESRLKGTNSNSLCEIYMSRDNKLKPDDHMHAMSELASTNGSVTATYRSEEGVLIATCSSETPKLHIEQFCPNETTVLDRLFASISKFI